MPKFSGRKVVLRGREWEGYKLEIDEDRLELELTTPAGEKTKITLAPLLAQASVHKKCANCGGSTRTYYVGRGVYELFDHDVYNREKQIWERCPGSCERVK